MAEFKITQRQKFSTEANLPSTNVYGRFAQAMGGVADFFGKLGGDINAEAQALEGAKERMEGGPRETLAPGITKATAAFNKSFSDMDSALVISSTTTQLSEDLIEAMKPENLSRPNNVQNYQQMAQARIQGALQGTLQSNRPQVALKLTQQAANSTLQLAQTQNKYDFDMARAQAAVSNAQLLDAIQNNSVEGNEGLALENQQELATSLNSQKELGMIDDLDEYKYLKQANQTHINARLERAFRNVWQEQGEEGAAKFIYDLEKTTDLTPIQKEQALNHIGSVNATILKSQTAVSNIGYNRIDQALNFQPDAYPTLQSLETAFIKSAQNGYPLTLAQKNDLQNQFFKRQAKINEANVKVTEVNRAIKTSDAGNLDAKDIDAWFFSTVNELKEENAALIQSNIPDKERILSQAAPWQIEASVAAQSKYTSIPAYTNLLTTRLYKGTTQEKMEAVSAFQFLQNVNPAALDGFNSTDKAFIESIVSQLEANASVPPEEIVAHAVSEVVNVPEEVRKLRNEQLSALTRAQPGLYDKLVKEVYGKAVGANLEETQALMRLSAIREFNKYYLISGDEKNAAKLAKKALEGEAFPSKFGDRKVPMWNPPERLPFYKQMGNTVENQLVRNLQVLVNTSEKHPEEGAPKIRWSKKMAEPPKSWTEDQKILGSYAPNGFWLNIDDVDRRVYLVSPTRNQTLQTGSNSPLYAIYYDRDGISTPLVSLQSQAIGEMDSTWTVGTTFMEFTSPDKYVPNAWNKMQRMEDDDRLMESAEKEIIKDVLEESELPSQFAFGQGEFFVSAQQRRKLKELKKPTVEKQRKELEAKRAKKIPKEDMTAAQIKQEQLKRAVKKAEEKLNK